MAEWKIDRHWTVMGKNGEFEIDTSELVGMGACGLLGTAGSGKTYEIESLHRSLEETGRHVVKTRIVEIAPDLSAESLKRGLAELSKQLTAETVLLLDEAVSQPSKY